MKNRWIEIFSLILLLATVVAGVMTTSAVAMLPPEWQPYMPLVMGLVLVLKQLAYGALDFLDDGQLNKSYKAPTTLLRVLAVMLLPLCLSQCVNDQSTDAELRRAASAVAFAQAGVDLAEIAYVARLSDPKTSVMEKAAASVALKMARERLTAESAKLERIRIRRAATLEALPSGGGAFPAKPLLLPELTQSK